MLFSVLTYEHGRQCGIDRDGGRQFDRNQVELMSLAEAEATAAKYGGCVVSQGRLYPADYQVAESIEDCKQRK